MVASRLALIIAFVAAVAACLVVPEVRCKLRLSMPAGQCGGAADGPQTPPGTPTSTSHVDAAVINKSPSGALPVQMIRLLTEADLEGKSDGELEIMRNEIYARRGRGFNRGDLRRYFGQFSWYRPIYGPEEFDNDHQALLTPIERWNAEFLLRHQRSR
jgi:hypothetical protein